MVQSVIGPATTAASAANADQSHWGAFHSPSARDARWRDLLRRHEEIRARLAERHDSLADVVEGIRMDIETLLYGCTRRQVD